jgi:hypothetical protein
MSKHAGQRGGDQQVGQAVALDDAVDDDDERAGRAADLHMRAAQCRDQEAGDDGGEDALLGLDARGDGKGHGQRKRHDAHGEPGAEVGQEAGAVIARQGVEQAGSESMELVGREHASSGTRHRVR